MALLVVELAGEHSAELALPDGGNPRRDQLRRAELVIDALPHPVSELALQGLAGGGGIEADIAPDPERAVFRGELPDELSGLGVHAPGSLAPADGDSHGR